VGQDGRGTGIDQFGLGGGRSRVEVDEEGKGRGRTGQQCFGVYKGAMDAKADSETPDWAGESTTTLGDRFCSDMIFLAMLEAGVLPGVLRGRGRRPFGAVSGCQLSIIRFRLLTCLLGSPTADLTRKETQIFLPLSRKEAHI